MSNQHNRRDFLKIAGASGLAATAALYTPFAIGGSGKNVVIIGGGMGGVPNIELETDRCNGCGACVGICPKSAIALIQK
ncbi:MAG: hypothetical protein Ctma_0092 [Catillopecten margaritatus gill symbiont]|uniref:4Fe-4S ferredoxin-type domain-containing protein n=1 Tax=Catillopecten margaritatus gill symbiont TaxID=3083288 RepID=A0AAU6PEE9_9GAMM